MIGIFDSGYGGLTILKEVVAALPRHNMIYLGDNARAPYGNRTQADIYRMTVQGVRRLFEDGCTLVILACNTASANALRRIQHEVLPMEYPDRQVLGIIVPTIEQLLKDLPQQSVMAVFATPATVASRAYDREVRKRRPDVRVVEQACPDLTTLIEADAPHQTIEAMVRLYARDLERKLEENHLPTQPKLAVLGCTHYPLVVQAFRRALPRTVALYSQAQAVARALVLYLKDHPEIASGLAKGKERRFLTTGNPERVSEVASRFFGEEIVFEHVDLRE